MTRNHWVGVMIGVLLAVLAVWQLELAEHGIDIRTEAGNPPLLIMTPARHRERTRPVVLVGHGFAGSASLMRGIGLSLAHAGYSAVLWDFSGHGGNLNPLGDGLGGDELLSDAEAALQRAQALGIVDPKAVAVLGHSMGSGVALAFGVKRAETAATIAISPVLRAVTLDLPRNLLLMAGAAEPNFIVNAESLLAQAGGEGGDPAAGTARALRIIPGVEHVSILFAPAAQRQSIEWLNAVFGDQPDAAAFSDLRMVWWLIGILGAVLLSHSLAPLGRSEKGAAVPPILPLWQHLGALLAGVLGASLLLWAASLVGLQTSQVFGLLIGGYLLLWFGLAGAISLGLLRLPSSLPQWRELFASLLSFAALWLGVGLLGGEVWLHWLLIPRRLLLWLPGILLLVPWFLAVGQAMRYSSSLGKVGWWLANAVVVVAGLLFALRLNPELGFLIIILPLLPVVLGLHALVAAPYRSAWSYALSGAGFVSWLLLAVFPLV